jgi:hypothetical protein
MDVTLRRVLATIVAVEKLLHIVMCICSLRYPPCNVHVPYCHLRLHPLYNILRQYLKTARFSKKKNPEHKMCVLISSTAFI